MKKYILSFTILCCIGIFLYINKVRIICMGEISYDLESLEELVELAGVLAQQPAVGIVAAPRRVDHCLALRRCGNSIALPSISAARLAPPPRLMSTAPPGYSSALQYWQVLSRNVPTETTQRRA